MDASAIEWVTYTDSILSMQIPAALRKVANPHWITRGPLARQSAITFVGRIDPAQPESEVTLIVYRDLNPTMVTILEAM